MELFAQSGLSSICKLFIQSERIRASTLGEMEQIKIVMSGAVRLSAVRVALYELSGTALRELDLWHKETMPIDVYFVLTYAVWDKINMPLAVQKTAS